MTLVSANTEPERSSEVASEPGPDAQVAHSPRSMRRAAMLASIWTVGGYGATQVIRLANSIVLSYFLAPDAFGIMALINIFLQGLIMSSDIGVGPSIIQHDAGEDPRFLDTAWSIQVIRGAVVCLLSLVFAWPMAAFYDQRQLLVLIPAAAIIPLLDGMASTAIFTVQRTLNVHKLTLLELISQIAGMVVMCVWAIMHPTVWALVGGTAVATLVKVAGSHVFLTPHRNRFAWDKSSVHDIVTFGKWIMVGTMIAFAALQVDRIVLGKLSDMNTLGLYSVALAIAQLPYMILLRLTYHVQHPVLSEWQRRSPDEMRRRFFGVRAAMLWAGLALTLCVYAGSPLFFRVVYHTNYHEAGSFAKLLCVASWGLILAETVTRALMVFGDSRSLAIYNLIRVLTTLAASFVGYRISGVQGFILGVALGILCGHVVLLFHLYCHRLTRPLQDVGMTIVLVTTASMVELAEAWGAHLPRPLLPQDSEMWPDGLKLITYGSLLGPVLAGVLALTSLALAWRQLRLGRSVR